MPDSSVDKNVPPAEVVEIFAARFRKEGSLLGIVGTKIFIGIGRAFPFVVRACDDDCTYEACNGWRFDPLIGAKGQEILTLDELRDLVDVEGGELAGKAKL